MWWVCGVAGEFEMVVLRGGGDEGFDGVEGVGWPGVDGGDAVVGEGVGGVGVGVGVARVVCFGCLIRVGG